MSTVLVVVMLFLASMLVCVTTWLEIKLAGCRQCLVGPFECWRRPGRNLARDSVLHGLPRGYRDLKKRPRVDFFGSANFAEITNLHNQAHV